MSILQRYILSHFLKTLLLCLLLSISLFLALDFFDRIDNFLLERASFGSILAYFFYKIPLLINLNLPISSLVATMLCVGVLSKNQEITAMRAAGFELRTIARPIFFATLTLSFVSMIFEETVVPYSTRKVNEISNLDIKRKDETGHFSQSDFWWRKGNQFYSVANFDSRKNTLQDLSALELSESFTLKKRIEAESVKWVDPILGWSMYNADEYRFDKDRNPQTSKFTSLALPIGEKPADFYDIQADPYSMSFNHLRKFIKRQRQNGVDVDGFKADLYAKLSFPFIIFIVSVIALPFAIKPARSGSLAVSFVAGLMIGFSYYAVNSFSLAMGRAELWNPFVAAWMANIVMGTIGLVLNKGAEAGGR